MLQLFTRLTSCCVMSRAWQCTSHLKSWSLPNSTVELFIPASPSLNLGSNKGKTCRSISNCAVRPANATLDCAAVPSSTGRAVGGVVPRAWPSLYLHLRGVLQSVVSQSNQCGQVVRCRVCRAVGGHSAWRLVSLVPGEHSCACV